MKNRLFSWILVSLSLVAWLTRLAKVHNSILSIPDYQHALSDDAFWEALPYVILCSITIFMSLPKLAYWILGIALLIVAGMGIADLSDFEGGDMHGPFVGMLYVFQIAVAIGAVLTALIAKAVAYS